MNIYAIIVQNYFRYCSISIKLSWHEMNTRLSAPPVNERTNNSVQACDPQSGLLVTRRSTREAGMGNGKASGTSEEKSGNLLHDKASAAAIIAPGTCTHDTLTQ